MKSFFNIATKYPKSVNSLKSHFRELTFVDNKHSNIFDFRDISESKPNNDFVITCEHATNNLHHLEKNLSPSDKQFVNTHWGYDIGAHELAIKVAEASESLLISSNFSRLILDPNRSLISSTLIRRTVEGNVTLDFNDWESHNIERESRIELFYIPYYYMLNEVFEFIKPKYFISVHSFTRYYENNASREFDIGLLYDTPNELSNAIEKIFKSNKVNYRVNEPYDTFLCHAYGCMQTYNWPNKTQGVLIEVRNDLAEDPAYSQNLVQMINQAMRNIQELKLNTLV